ncbi:hypothetical protein MMC18_006588 [Xylographa bjoerkii]|nr:hypothetical protein [Xylographa bjoerkii]
MSTSNLARVRDNQRRSRARRKEHLHNTEKRLRELEREGVKVSTDIQKAARRVVEENIRLRAMLRQRGVEDVEIDESLRGGVNGTQESAPLLLLPISSPPITPGSLASSPRHLDVSVLLSQHDDHSCKADNAIASPVVTEERQILASIQDTPREYRVNTRSGDATELHGDSTPLRQPANNQMTNGHHPQNAETSNPQPRALNTTSCLLAANILASMCSAKTAAEVSAELGCFSGTDCEVDNVKLFQIMDR